MGQSHAQKLVSEHFPGPFDKPPFFNFIQSLNGLVPRDGGVETHLILHLSYPRTGKSVNSETLWELCTVQYKELDYAIAMCLQEGRYCFTAKSDMKSTFQNLSIKPQDWCWLLMVAYHPITKEKYYFVDKCLPFGAIIPFAHFQRFSNSVSHIFKKSTGKKTNNYLDWFPLCCPDQSLVQWAGRCNVWISVRPLISQ